MLIKKLATLISLLVLIVIGQATFADFASATRHNCWRPPYCFMVYGTVEEIPSVSNLVPAESPKKILIMSTPQATSDNSALKVWASTESDDVRIVELDEDPGTPVNALKEELRKKHVTKAQGYMVLSLPKPGTSELPLLVDFIPADPNKLDPTPSSISRQEAWQLYERYKDEHYKKLPAAKKAPKASKMTPKK